MVDSTDKARLGQVANEFQMMLTEEELLVCPVLVLANKQDLEGCMPPSDISDTLGLAGVKERDWAIYKCSAKTGEGLEEAMGWLARTIRQKK